MRAIRPPFPLLHGTEATLDCSPYYDLEGDTVVTCDGGHTFTYSNEPRCTRLWEEPGKSHLISGQELRPGIQAYTGCQH